MNQILKLSHRMIICGLLLFFFLNSVQAQISFVGSNLSGEISDNPTSLQFGPDGRLYVAQQDGTIHIYTIIRNDAENYAVIATETINLIKEGTPNHDDDGSLNTTQIRQITGLLVVGSAQNPVIYVSSSDWRIAVDNDSNLDTNSGVITRLTKNANSWDRVDLIRGLPRCEENHSTNGMVLDEASNTLYVMSGGHTNMGAQSASLGMTPEYALSAALLSVDLTAIEAMPVYQDSRTNTPFIYDIPTLDDPTRANIDNTHEAFPYPAGHPLYNATIDLGDPFGGNDGLNQGRLIENGPIEIYSPGYRNAYDIVLTENGRMYTFDNGPNGGWGGPPLIYDSTDTNQGIGPWQEGMYASNERNESDSYTYWDGLHYITGKGYYAGHPNPTRANPLKSGVYTYDKSGSNWVLDQAYDFATDFPELPVPASMANPVESDYRAPGANGSLAIITSSTNGMDEYTASNFNGVMKGQLLAASFNGNIYRFKLNAAGDQVEEQVAEFSGFGSQPLDVSTQGDNDIFPGTVWVAVYGSDNIVVFEPNDFGNGNACVSVDDPNYDPLLDSDYDGFANGDEVLNGTNHCSAGSKPADFDGTIVNGLKVSDFNDLDDDEDGILDINDPFVWDAANGLNTNLPVIYPFTNGNPGTGFFGLGFTGLMSNGSADYMTLFSADNITAGGAGGNFTIDAVTAGDPYGSKNSQEYAFQFGINVDQTSRPFTAHTKLLSPFFNNLPPVSYQSWGMYLGRGDQDNYIKIVFSANHGRGGVEVLFENQGGVKSNMYNTFVVGDLFNAGSVDLYLGVDPANLTVQAYVSIDGGGTKTALGTPITIPASWLDANDDIGLAIGLISTASSSGNPFNAKWDFIHVTEDVVTDSEAQALFIAKPPVGNIITGSTYNSQSYVITNESPEGSDLKISSVQVDMTTNIVPNVAFDPYGTAGDPIGKDFTPNVGVTETGYLSREFFAPIGNGGYQGLTINFEDFDPGETFKFSIDADHISIEGLPEPGPGDAGSITGLEMVGSVITVNFTDGTSYTHELYSDGSDLGSLARLKSKVINPPSISINGSAESTIVAEADHTVDIFGGNPNGTISLLRVEGAQFEKNYLLNFEPFEINNIIKIERLTQVVLDASGNASVPLKLTKSDPEAGFNYMIAVQEDGEDFGDLSNLIKLQYNPVFDAKTTVTELILIDANTDEDIVQLQDGLVINLSELSGNDFSIRAITSGGEESVRFELTGPFSHNQTESTPPYAIFGDNTAGSSVDYNGQVFPVGNYTLSATPYQENGANGDVGTPWVINFSIVEQQTTTYNLEISADIGGSASANLSDTVLESGTTVSITAASDAGYQFTGWANEVGSIISIANPYTFDMLSNTVLEAKFTLIPTTNQITTYTLIDALNNTDLINLTEGMKINLDSLPTNHLSIRANTSGGDESVQMILTGPLNQTKTESIAPYALFGDKINSSGERDYTGADFLVGDYTIQGTPYTENGASGEAGIVNTLNFSLIGTRDHSLLIQELILIRADTDEIIGDLTEGLVIDLSTYPPNTEFAILAKATNNTESVEFGLSGDKTFTKVESLAPYSLYGDGNGGSDFYGEILNAGAYTIKVTPFGENGAAGQKGVDYIINFSVINSTSARATEPVDLMPNQQKSPEQQSLKAYPNPILEGKIILEFPVMIKGKLKYTLVDALNRVLYEAETSFKEPSTKLRLDFSDLRLQPGTYYIKAIDEKSNYFGVRLQK